MDFLSFLNLSPRDLQLPLHLATVGHWEHQERTRRPEGFSDYQWLQCVSGTGELRVGQEHHFIKPGQGFFLLPYEAHAYQPLSEPWELYWLSFNGSLAMTLLQQAGITKSGVYSTIDSDTLVAAIHHIYEQTLSTHPFIGVECSKLLYSFLLDLTRKLWISSSSTEQSYIKLSPVFQYIEAYYQKMLTITELADCITVSPQHLCHLFRSTLQMRPIEYVNRQRISKSKEYMLREPRLKIHQIAAIVGFESPSYFTSVFRKIEGVSPGQFKSLHGIRE